MILQLIMILKNRIEITDETCIPLRMPNKNDDESIRYAIAMMNMSAPDPENPDLYPRSQKPNRIVSNHIPVVINDINPS